MLTITEKEFFERFMIISQDLTYAEVRMLYLLIAEPDIIELSQQVFANRIQAHRRTINIGLKKLRKLKYIGDSFYEEENNEVINNGNIDSNAILKHEELAAKKTIIRSFENYYTINKKSFIIYEDFYSFVLGDIRLPPIYRLNKAFITETIRESYPEVRFYFDQKKSSYKDDNHYNIVYIN
jgi:hypothetical protein